MGLEVVDREGRAEDAEAVHEPRAEVSGVERIGAVVREGPKGAREGRLGETVALGRDPIAEEDVRETGVPAEAVGASREAPREVTGDGEPLGGLDRGAERLTPRPDRSLAVDGLPSADGAGDRDRGGAGVGHRGAVGGSEPCGVGGGGCPAGRVDRHELPVRVLHQGEEVPADPAHVRVHDRERDRGVERGVDGVAPGREGGSRCLGGEGMRCGDGPSLSSRRERVVGSRDRRHPRSVRPR